MHAHTHVHCGAEILHLREKHLHEQTSPPPPLPAPYLFASTIATSSIARGQQPLFFPAPSFFALPSLLSHMLRLSRASLPALLLPILLALSSSTLHFLPHHFIYSSSPLSSSHYCPRRCSSGQRSWPRHSLMLTPRPPAVYSFSRRAGGRDLLPLHRCRLRCAQWTALGLLFFFFLFCARFTCASRQDTMCRILKDPCRTACFVLMALAGGQP